MGEYHSRDSYATVGQVSILSTQIADLSHWNLAIQLALDPPARYAVEMVIIQDTPIDTQSLLSRVTHADAGAVVLFVGTTRRFTGERETSGLQYECYEKMAEQKLVELEHLARQRWPIKECAIAHRTGPVAVAEASVAVAVSTPHRRDAFEAGQWLIDRLKKVVPIWKQEHFTDGSQEWVHPGIEISDPTQTLADHDAT